MNEPAARLRALSDGARVLSMGEIARSYPRRHAVVRLFPVILLALAAVPRDVHAAGWRPYLSHKYGFALRYPAGWHVTSSYLPGSKQVAFGIQGKTPYSLTVVVLPFGPQRSLDRVVQRFKTYVRTTGQTVAGAHWSPVRVGKSKAMATVERPSTEGGVSLAEGLYLTQSRSRTFEIIAIAYGHPAPAKLGSFPVVYKQMLAAWRTL
jgi:hypothetical protein